MSRFHNRSTTPDPASGSSDEVIAVIEAGVLHDALMPVSTLTDFSSDNVAVFSFTADGLRVEAMADSGCGSVTVNVGAAGFERYRQSYERKIGLDVSKIMKYLALVDVDDCVEIGECADSRLRFETTNPRFRYIVAGDDPALVWGRELDFSQNHPVHVVLSGDILNTFFQVVRFLHTSDVSLVADSDSSSLSASASGDGDHVDLTTTPQQVTGTGQSIQELVTFADLCITMQDVLPDSASVRYSIGRGAVVQHTTVDGHVDVKFMIKPVSREAH